MYKRQIQCRPIHYILCNRVSTSFYWCRVQKKTLNITVISLWDCTTSICIVNFFMNEPLTKYQVTYYLATKFLYVLNILLYIVIKQNIWTVGMLIMFHFGNANFVTFLVSSLSPHCWAIQFCNKTNKLCIIVVTIWNKKFIFISKKNFVVSKKKLIKYFFCNLFS